MNEENGNRGLWIILVLALCVALTFVVLWFMRGSEIDRLAAEHASASSSAQRFERELRDTRQTLENSERRARELDNQMRAEARRALENAAQMERRFRTDLQEAERRLSTANAELKATRETVAAKDEEVSGLAGELQRVKSDSLAACAEKTREAESLASRLEAADTAAKDLETRLAAATAESDAMKARLGETEEAFRVANEQVRDQLARTAAELVEARNAQAVLDNARKRLGRVLTEEKTAFEARERSLRVAIAEAEAKATQVAATELAGSIGEEVARLNAELAKANADLSEARNANAVLEEVRERLSQAMAREKDAFAAREKELLATLERRTDGDGASEAEGEAAAWRQRAEALEKEFAEFRGRTAAELKATEDTLQSEIRALKREFDAWLRRSKAVAQSADEAWRGRIDKADKDAAGRERLLSDRLEAADNDNQTLKTRVATLEKEVGEWKNRVAESLHGAGDDARKQIESLETLLKEAQARAASMVGEVEEAWRRRLEDTEARTAARVAELETDAQAYKKELDALVPRIEQANQAAAQAAEEAARLAQERTVALERETLALQVGEQARQEMEKAILRLETDKAAALEDARNAHQAALESSLKHVADAHADAMAQAKQGYETLLKTAADTAEMEKRSVLDKAVRELETRLAELRNELTAERDAALAEATRRHEELAAAKARADDEIAALREREQQARAELSKAVETAKANAETARREAEALAQRLEKDKTDALARARREFDALMKNAADAAAADKAAALEKAAGEHASLLAAEVGRLSGERDAALAAAQKRYETLDAARMAAETKVAELRALASRTKAEADRLGTELAATQAREKEALGKNDRLGKELETVTGERDAALARVKETDAASAALSATVAELEQTGEALRTELASLEERMREVSKVAGLDAASFALNRPGRTVGTIIERAPDGTLVLSLGSRQRVRAGMVFDVYRPVGDRNRYIGSVKVVRVTNDRAVAVPTYAAADVMACPVTGRAVLEPGAIYSPFIAGEGGTAIELQKTGVIGVPFEAPAAGDFIDNPFFEPGRRVSFAVTPTLAGDAKVKKTIEMLGGTSRAPSAGGDADFLVIGDDEFGGRLQGGTVRGQRLVTVGHLESYLDSTQAR